MRDHVDDVIKELIEGKIIYSKDLPIIEIVEKENKILKGHYKKGNKCNRILCNKRRNKEM
jgi:hypothetical protein